MACKDAEQFEDADEAPCTSPVSTGNPLGELGGRAGLKQPLGMNLVGTDIPMYEPIVQTAVVPCTEDLLVEVGCHNRALE